MAKAIIGDKEHPVRVNLIIEGNYGVSVLGTQDAPRATVTLASRPPVVLRYKIHADNPEAAVRKALELMKAAGSIDGYVLEPHEEAPPPPEPKAAAPKAEKPAAAARPEKPAAPDAGKPAGE